MAPRALLIDGDHVTRSGSDGRYARSIYKRDTLFMLFMHESNVVRCLPLVNEIKITEKSARYRRQARLVAVLLSCDAMLHMQPIYVVCQSVCLSVCPSVRHKSVLSAETAKHNHANNAAR